MGWPMASRPRHPNKEIEEVIRYAEKLGWTVKLTKGHGWGSLYCPKSSREGCIVFVWSTPRRPQDHAKDIRRDVNRCEHGEG